MSATAEGDEQVAVESAEPDAYGVGRLLAFSDGVFAIAITLLVLSLPAPTIPVHPGENGKLAGALLSLWPNLTAFVLSFVLVGVHWMIHHRLLRLVKRIDRSLMWLNLAALLGICLVPFGSAILTRYGDVAVGTVAYATVQLLISAAYIGLRLRLGDTRTGVAIGLLQTFSFAASIPVAFASTQAAYAMWLGGFGLARVLDNRLRSHT